MAQWIAFAIGRAANMTIGRPGTYANRQTNRLSCGAIHAVKHCVWIAAVSHGKHFTVTRAKYGLVSIAALRFSVWNATMRELHETERNAQCALAPVEAFLRDHVNRAANKDDAARNAQRELMDRGIVYSVTAIRQIMRRF